MFPDLLTLQTPFGEQALHTYGLLLILGFFAATVAATSESACATAGVSRVAARAVVTRGAAIRMLTR